MRILTVYSPAEAGLYRVWERSWRSRGFEPGIISAKEIQKRGSSRAAAKARRSRLPVHPPRLINFSLTKGKVRRQRFSYARFGSSGWEKAPVVLFPEGTTEAQILNCGRRV
jgi:hypothetical protein